MRGEGGRRGAARGGGDERVRTTAARGGGAVRTADSFGHLADGEEAVDLEDGDGAGRDLRHLEVEQVGRLELPSARCAGWGRCSNFSTARGVC